MLGHGPHLTGPHHGGGLALRAVKHQGITALGHRHRDPRKQRIKGGGDIAVGFCEHPLGADLGAVSPAIGSRRVFVTSSQTDIRHEQAAIIFTPTKRPLAGGLNGLDDAELPIWVAHD